MIKRKVFNFTIISIHAAREGGDNGNGNNGNGFGISIHAAREGGDRSAEKV